MKKNFEFGLLMNGHVKGHKLTIQYFVQGFVDASIASLFIRSNSKCKVLELDMAFIKSDAIFSIIEAARSTEIKELHFNQCTIGKEGAKALSKSLSAFSDISRVDFGNSKFSQKSAEYIFGALTQHSFLDISFPMSYIIPQKLQAGNESNICSIKFKQQHLSIPQFFVHKPILDILKEFIPDRQVNDTIIDYIKMPIAGESLDIVGDSIGEA